MAAYSGGQLQRDSHRVVFFGLITDDGYGWAFLPFMIATAPWSFFAPMLAREPVGDWFLSGLVGNFALFVVVCGGINSFLLYKLVDRVLYQRTDSVNTILL
jgi:hypothetical protein